MSSLMIKRDSEGNVLPIKGLTPTLGLKVTVLPLTYGQSRQYESFSKGAPLSKWTSEEKAMLITENILDVDGEELEIISVKDLEEGMDAWTVEDLVHAVGIFSGLRRLFEAQDEGNVTEGPTGQS